jgi:hypothetical protein
VFSPALVGGALQQLQACEGLLSSWQDDYTAAVRRVSAAMPARPWDFDHQGHVLAHAGGFLQRCADLKELCASHQQFRVAGLASAFPPAAAQAAEEFAETELRFLESMARQGQCMRGAFRLATTRDRRTIFIDLSDAVACRLQQRADDSLLDLGSSDWTDAMAAFRATAHKLDVRQALAAAAACEAAPTLTARLTLVTALSKLAVQDELRRAADRATWLRPGGGSIAWRR